MGNKALRTLRCQTGTARHFEERHREEQERHLVKHVEGRILFLLQTLPKHRPGREKKGRR